MTEPYTISDEERDKLEKPAKPAKAEKGDKGDKDADKAEKEKKKLEAAHGLLSPEDRYKALVNGVKAAQDLIELGDKKARLALVIMSVLNAVVVLLVVRGGSVMPTVGTSGAWVRVEFAIYAVTTVYYITRAVAALRPRGVKMPQVSDLPSVVVPGASMRVLFYADVVARSRDSYQALWTDMRMDNLCTELADQMYALSWINWQKYEALRKLYFGLRLMTVQIGAIIGTMALWRFIA